MTGNTSGSVIDYNLSVDIIFTGGSGQFLMPSYYSHNAGNDMDLWEGNNFQVMSTDDEWGASNTGTYFRNMNQGWQNGKSATTNAFIDRAFARANNVIGNIQGQAGYHNTYESYATSPSGGVNGGAVYTSIYNLGWTGADGDGQCTAPPICDAVVRSTLMRWGNYDVVHAATQWNSTEASPGAVAYVNANFTSSYFNTLSQTLPASLYYSSNAFVVAVRQSVASHWTGRVFRERRNLFWWNIPRVAGNLFQPMHKRHSEHCLGLACDFDSGAGLLPEHNGRPSGWNRKHPQL